jgi:hypothetical protein
MRLEITHHSIPGFPPPVGPHELAWSYILDTIFADAYHTGIASLHISLPTKQLYDDVTLRAELSQTTRKNGQHALALLGKDRNVAGNYGRIYLLNFGATAPRTLQRLSVKDLPGARREYQQSLFSLKARFWGIPIRLAHAMKRPDLVDRAMFAMRRDFAQTEDPYAFYRLSIWSKA